MPVRHKTVCVALGERSYDIHIGQGLLGRLGEMLSGIKLKGKALVVTNPVIGRRYGRTALRSLKQTGFQASILTVPEGEQTKSLSWASSILDALVAHRFERQSVVIALGGGVIGDLAGFAASLYMRGIPFVQVPTTLVAQVDSSVGGKTGVNHPLGKNLIGTFHQPHVVIIDTDTLQSLPEREWRAGLAEVIKYGVIADPTFFAYLERNMAGLLARETKCVMHAVQRSCQIKAQVVSEDERESDRRRILNYGHTIGHALESFGQYRTLIHGEAVAIGMVQEADLARHLGFCSSEVVARQTQVIHAAALPVSLPTVTAGVLWAAMQHDKKVLAGKVQCVFPTEIGSIRIAPIERPEFAKWLSTVRSRRTQSAPTRSSLS